MMPSPVALPPPSRPAPAPAPDPSRRQRLPPPAPRRYANHTIDGSAWERLEHRAGDVVVSTSLKSGTTWMQFIVLHLIHGDAAGDMHTPTVSPWIDEAGVEVPAMLASLARQRHRRVVKSHLPLDGHRHRKALRYVVVARDPRDVALSLHHHYRHIAPASIAAANAGLAPDERLPPAPDDFLVFFRRWISRGWFAWESEGYPFWSNLHHTESWHAFAHLENVLLVHHDDLVRRPELEIARVARHIGIAIDPARASAIARATSFEAMAARAGQFLEGDGASLVGGARTFFREGTNGGWRGVLGERELELLEAACARETTPECRAWLLREGDPEASADARGRARSAVR